MRYRPATVEVMQVQPGNEIYVATWCGGVVAHDRVWIVDGDGAAHIAHQGDWIVRNPFGEFSVVKDSRIFGLFDSVLPAVAE
jgi:hypothetical protein